MAVEVERLIAVLEARMDKYEKSLKKAYGDTDRTFTKIEHRGNAMEKKLKELGSGVFVGLATGAVGAIAGIASLQGALQGLNEALDYFGKVADQSAAAGIDSEFFQGIAYNAKLAGVETDNLAGALATFAKASGQLGLSQGRLYSTLSAINPQLVTQLQLAGSQEQRLRLVADAIAQARDDAQAATIAASAFGDQGARLVAVFRNGGDAIDVMVTKAREAGVVVDREVVAYADQLGDKFDAANMVLDTKLKVSMLELGDLVLWAKERAVDLAGAFAVAADQVKDISRRTALEPLQTDLSVTQDAISRLTTYIADFKAGLVDVNTYGGMSLNLSEAEAELADMTAKADALISRIRTLANYNPDGQLGRGGPGRNASGQFELPGMLGRGGPGRIKPVEPFYTPGGGSDRAAAGLSKVAQSAAVAGAALSGASKATGDLSDALDTAEQMTEGFASTFVSDLRQGKSAAEALVDALGNVVDQLASLALNNVISGLFGGIKLGGTSIGGGGSAAAAGAALFGRASGGPVNRGQAYVVGERGREVLVPSSAGVIVPQVRSGGDAAAGGAISVAVQVGVVNGNLVPLVTSISGEVAGRKIRAEAPAAVAAAQRNRSLRG